MVITKEETFSYDKLDDLLDKALLHSNDWQKEESVDIHLSDFDWCSLGYLDSISWLLIL